MLPWSEVGGEQRYHDLPTCCWLVYTYFYFWFNYGCVFYCVLNFVGINQYHILTEHVRFHLRIISKPAPKIKAFCFTLFCIPNLILVSGNVDGFWLEGLHIWDMAAAVVIASEAGGVVTSTVPGEEFDLTRRRVIVASTEQLAEEIRDRIVRAPDGIFKREHC